MPPPSSMALGAIVNVASGSADASTAEKLRALLTDLGVHEPRIWEVDADGLVAALEEANNAGLDALIVYGGDGTIRTAAESCREDGPALIPLPGGTMNLLPKALYGDQSWEDILRATLANPVVKDVSGGRVGEERFFIAAILGAPTVFVKAREALRQGAVGAAVEHGREALATMQNAKVNYEFNEMHTGTADALVLTCPLVSESLDDDRRALEAAVIDVESAEAAVQLATAAAFGNWRDARNVAIVATKQVKADVEGGVPMLLDGEPVEGDSALVIEFVPHAFRALVPA